MSEIKVNKLTPRTNCGTVTLGDSGDTFTIPSGVTISNSGTAAGFGATGAVSWDTSSIKTAGFTATSGIGYFCNTTGGIFTVALPAGSAGDVVGIADYAQTFGTDNLTISPDGSEKIGGNAASATMSVSGVAATLVYVDAAQGWIVTDSGLSSDVPPPTFITATGGTPCSGAISGDYKIHTFTGPGTLCVSQISNITANNEVSYLVVAGGASGGNGCTGGGGGGAGGFRESKSPVDSYTASPIEGSCAVTVTASPYAIVVGGGGPAASNPNIGTVGNISSFACITSAGGGGGGKWCSGGAVAGGSGGGQAGNTPPVAGGVGNTPPTSPAQGFPGGADGYYQMAGGGGATTAGAAGNPSPSPASRSPSEGCGGTGATTSISATPTAYAGGGGGGFASGSPYPAGLASGGTGGGGNGGGMGIAAATAGGINTGGGGGGAGSPNGDASGAGGSGIVVIRYKFQ